MLDGRVHRLPVVDVNGALVGIVTRADLVRAFARTDDDIEREIRKEVIERLVDGPTEQVLLTVKDGEVTLDGEVGRSPKPSPAGHGPASTGRGSGRVSNSRTRRPFGRVMSGTPRAGRSTRIGADTQPAPDNH